MYVECPANLSLVDSQGRHLGYNTTCGLVDQQIPDALPLFSENAQVITVFNRSGNYSLQVIGSGDSAFTLEILQNNETCAVATLWNSSGTKSKDTTLYYSISNAESSQVSVTPEFATSFLLLLFIRTTLSTAIAYRSKHSENARDGRLASF